MGTGPDQTESDFTKNFMAGVQALINADPTQGATPGSRAGLPTASSNTSPLYIGYGPQPTNNLWQGVTNPVIGPESNTVFGSKQWLTDLQSNDKSGYDQLVSLLRASGLLSPTAKAQSSVDAAFQKAAELAASNTTGIGTGTGAGPAELTSWLVDRATSAAKDPSPSATQVTTINDSSVNLTGPITAKAIITNAYSRLIGRQASPQDMEDFYAKLNEEERANPTIRTGSSTVTAQGTDRSTSSNTTTSGGIDSTAAAQIAQDQVVASPTYAGTVANTTLMNWFQEAILAPAAGKVL